MGTPLAMGASARSVQPSLMDRRAAHPARRLFHMTAASIFPGLALWVPRDVFLVLLLGATALLVAADIVRLLVPPVNGAFRHLFGSLMRVGEEHRVTGATYVLLGTLACFLLFPRDVAIVSVLYVALGDPVAALVGGRLSRGRLFGKSLWGSAAMAAVNLAVVGFLHLAGAVDVSWGMAVGAVAAVVVELLPLPLNDNLSVPLAAGAVMVLPWW